MAFALDEIFAYGGQLIVAAKKRVPKALGIGNDKIDHSAYIEGNTQIGKVDAFSGASATLMVGREGTKGTDRSLHVNGNAQILGDSGTQNALYVTGGSSVDSVYIKGDLYVTGQIDGGNKGRLAARFSKADGLPPKSFDIEHPTKGKGWRLRYVCLEGPEAGVYFRGRIKNEKVIKLPDSWKGLVHTDSISVQLQPVGSHQDIIVKRWDDEFIYLQAQGGLPINCFYHVYGERKDVNPVLVEYEGNSRYDYPDPNWNEKSEMDPEEINLRDPNYLYPRNTYTT
jgi:cytoskeletal protein CcmA (bactofilin family)